MFIQRLRGGPLQALLGGTAGAVGEWLPLPLRRCVGLCGAVSSPRRFPVLASAMPTGWLAAACEHLACLPLSASPPPRLPAHRPSHAEPTLIDAVQAYSGWDFVQVDAALRGSDPHAVGVAVKPLEPLAAAGSVDGAAFEALMRRNKGRGKRR